MKKICNIFSSVILVVLLVLSIAIVVPMLFGMKEMAVLSGSMEPNIPVGSIVYIDHDVDIAEVQPNDVVTYYLDSDTFVTHRVVSVDYESQTLVTKGDANEADDGTIQFSQYYGKVQAHIPYLGYISANIRTPVGIMTATVLIVVIILLNALPAIFAKEESPEENAKEAKTDDSKVS